MVEKLGFDQQVIILVTTGNMSAKASFPHLDSSSLATGVKEVVRGDGAGEEWDQ